MYSDPSRVVRERTSALAASSTQRKASVAVGKNSGFLRQAQPAAPWRRNDRRLPSPSSVECLRMFFLLSNEAARLFPLGTQHSLLGLQLDDRARSASRSVGDHSMARTRSRSLQ